jgi:conjugal transfer pilus assembly protein TraE
LNLTNWKQSYHALKTEAGLTRVALAGCAVALALLSFNAVSQHTTVVVQPFGMQKIGWVSEDNASQSYKEAWGYSLAMMLGNIDPGNLEFVKKRISPLLPTDLYQQTMTNLQAQVIMMRENRVTATFDPLEITYEKSSDKVFVYGKYKTETPSVKPKQEMRTYEFKITMESYLPQIISMDTYADVPHTSKRKAEIAKMSAEQRKKQGLRN